MKTNRKYTWIKIWASEEEKTNYEYDNPFGQHYNPFGEYAFLQCDHETASSFFATYIEAYSDLQSKFNIYSPNATGWVLCLSDNKLEDCYQIY